MTNLEKTKDQRIDELETELASLRAELEQALDERERLQASERSAHSDLGTINAFATALQDLQGIDDVLWGLAQIIGEQLSFPDCVIYLRDGDNLVQRAAYGIKSPASRDITHPIVLKIGQGIAGNAAASGQFQLVADTSRDPRYIFDQFPGQSELAVPVLFEGTVIGVIDSEADEKDFYSVVDAERVTSLARIAAPRIASAQLQASEKKYRGLFDNVIDGAFQTTVDGKILSWNAPLMSMLGYDTDEELQQLDLNRDVYADPDQRQKFMSKQEKGGSIRNVEVRLRRKNGDLITVLMNSHAVRDGDGRVLYFEGTLTDITERKRLEEQFRQAQKMEAIGQLAGGIAHDFNNLLTPIIGYSELELNRIAPDDPLRRGLEMVLRAGNKAADLTRQLLAFSRQQVVQPKVLDLNNVVAKFENLLRRTIEENIEILVDLDPDLGRVKADPGQIEQVLLNLAVNARDAMFSGGTLTIETANVELDESYANRHSGMTAGPHVLLVVTDSGEGMDEDTLGHIFEPFFTTKPIGEGTGLGLATVYGIVKQSGGYVRVYSEPGRGTTFKIYWPRIAEAVAGATQDRTVGDETGGSETILVVEDEEMVRQFAVQTLENMGYKVLEAEHPAHAFEVSHNHEDTIDLLVTDLVMPGSTGVELAEQLAKTHPETKILYISGYADKAILRDGQLEPHSQFLGKPFSASTLARKVRKILDGRNS